MRSRGKPILIGTGDGGPTTDVVVLEDDTCGVLAAPLALRPDSEHPVRLYTSLHEFTPYPAGSLRQHGDTLYAMVVELDNEPACDGESIRRAADNLMQHPLIQNAGSIRLQLLGCVHAGLEPRVSLTALSVLFDYLERYRAPALYLEVPPEHRPAAADWLKRRIMTENPR